MPERPNDQPEEAQSDNGIPPLLAAGALIASRYRLDQRLGEGGMGEVWAATHAVTRRRVAVKFLKSSVSSSPEMRRRILREARAATLVRHRNVVEVIDVFELENGAPVMVMALMSGETLGAKLARQKTLAVGEVAALLLPVVDAVRAAHAQGIVHRDLKPDNIFLMKEDGSDPIVKVLDFGIAKLTATEGSAIETSPLTITGALIGSPNYMSPEQCCGEKDIDQRADVWAVGVILYECLAGQRPVDGSNLGQFVTRLLRDDIVPLEARVPEVPAELAHVVGRMLSRQREDRPRDLTEIRAVLSGMADHTASEKIVADVPPSERVTTSRSSGLTRVPAIAATAIAVIVIIAWSVMRVAPLRASEDDRLDKPAMQLTNVSPVVRPPDPASTGVVESATLPPPPPGSTSLRPTLVPTSEPVERPHRRIGADTTAPLVAASGSPSADPPRRKPARRGVFEQVPF